MTRLEPGESVLASSPSRTRYPVLSIQREHLRRRRFYHHFRTDPESPLRAPQISTRTPVLAHDGRDLAAALRTVEEIGDEALHRAVAAALDGAHLEVSADGSRFAELPCDRDPHVIFQAGHMGRVVINECRHSQQEVSLLAPGT